MPAVQAQDKWRLVPRPAGCLDETHLKALGNRQAPTSRPRSRPSSSARRAGIVRHATVTLEPDGKWFVSLTIQRRSHKPKPRALPPVGVDLGVVVPFALSTGKLLGEAFRSLSAKEAERLRRLERSRERQTMGSKNRAKTQLQINRLKARQRRRRTNFIEQVSAHLAKNHSPVAFRTVGKKHDPLGERHARKPRQQCAAEGRLNRALLDRSSGYDGHPQRQKLTAAAAPSSGYRPPQLPDVPGMQGCGSREPRQPRPLRLLLLRLRWSC